MVSNILTLQEIAKYLKVNPRTIHRLLKPKQIPSFKVRNQWRFKKEDIDKWIENNNIENAKNNKGDKNGGINVPVIGKVSAGSPILAVENIENYLTVDHYFSKDPDKVFVLRVKGDSMINAAILDGDFVLVHQQPTAEQGEIVVALIEDEATVKRFYQDKNKIRLQPGNDAMKPIIIDPKDKKFMILGKVEAVIRKV